MTVPTEIADGETVIRCCFLPYHVKGGRLHWKAFQPPRDGRLSVVRLQYSTPDLCKAHGVALANAAQDKEYTGLAAILTQSIRACRVDVVDAPDDAVVGHAEIVFNYTYIDNEPSPTAEETAAMVETCKELRDRANYYADPAPVDDGWHGEPITSPQFDSAKPE